MPRDRESMPKSLRANGSRECAPDDERNCARAVVKGGRAGLQRARLDLGSAIAAATILQALYNRSGVLRRSCRLDPAERSDTNRQWPKHRSRQIEYFSPSAWP